MQIILYQSSDLYRDTDVYLCPASCTRLPLVRPDIERTWRWASIGIQHVDQRAAVLMFTGLEYDQFSLTMSITNIIYD